MKPPKENEKLRKQVCFNEKVNHACYNGKNNSDQNIHAYMTRKSGSDECPGGSFDDSYQLTNWILDYGATCHIIPEVLYFIPLLLKYTYKYIEVADRNHVTEKQKKQVQIKMCNDNEDTFIATLHNVLLESDLRNRLFSTIMLMNLGHTCLFQKGFCTVYFGAEEKNTVTLPHIAQRKHAFLGEIKEMSKTMKLPYRWKIALKLLYQRLDHRSARSLLAGDNANV